MDSRKVKVQCKYCGKVEYVCPSRAKKYVTCSTQCMGAYNHIRYSKGVDKECPCCHKIFKVKRSALNRRVYCSKKCMVADLPRKYSGDGNPNYKGRTMNSDNYIIDKCKFTIHRQTVQDILGVDKLPDTLVVHHKDGDKHSNDPHNLILLTHKIHTWIHKNIGNYAFKAIANNKLSIEDVLSWIEKDEDKKIAEYILRTDCTQQSVVLKQGELLGTPI